MLAYTGGNDRVAPGNVVDRLDNVVGLDERVVAIVVMAVGRFQFGHFPVPLGKAGRKTGASAVGGQSPQGFGQHADVMPVSALHLADLRGVHVKVDNPFCFRGELSRYTGDAIVKASAHGDQQVAVIHGVVGVSGAVHAEHAQGESVGGVERAQTH